MKPTSVLVVVAGPPGSGKTRLAEKVSSRTGARLVRSASDADEPLPGTDPTELPDPAEYQALARAVRTVLEAGRSSVVVAPFHTRASRRELMSVAAETRAALLYVECSANAVVRRRRLRDRRLADGKGPGEELERDLDRVLAADTAYEPVLDELPRACQMLIDTTVGVELWAGLAASRVEGFLAAGVPGEAKAISAG